MSATKWIAAEEEFKSWFSTKQSFCFQFHDARQAKGAGGSQRIFTTSHPSDFVVADHGVMFFAEVKSSQDPASFPFSSVQKAQWSAAIQATAAGCLYYFFIRSEVLKKWFRIPAALMIDMRNEGVKSVKWQHLLALEYI